MFLLRPLLVFAGLLLAWAALVRITGVESFILPGPGRVAVALLERWPTLLQNGLITAAEILLGLLLGTLLGILCALTVAALPRVRPWVLPLLVVSQAIPVFALAPVLVLWLGYGLASKVAMATLIIFFPVTAAFLDGLRRTEPGWLDLARTMNVPRRAVLLHIRVPAALPALASGLRVATAVAPIGAVVGEWVGSSAGLGHLMLHANARMQIDLMFAALLLLALFSVALYFTVDRLLRLALPWQAEDGRQG